MSETKELITPRKYHSASLYLNDEYYPNSNVLAAGSTLTGIECIIRFDHNELVFHQSEILLSSHLGDIKLGDKVFSLTYDQIKCVNVSLTRRGLFNWRNPEYPNGRYVLDIEIELKDNVVYHFEANALTVIDQFVQTLKNHKIEVVDQLNLVEYLKPIIKETKPIYDFIDKNYDDLAKHYHLDNPRLKIEVE